jgi:pilus assembly protein CpaF
MAPEAIIVQSRPEPRPTLDMMAANGTLSPAMATVLKIAAICQLNIMITGTASSGKTTLLNAILPAIHNDERIVVIEYASELLLEQPHFVRFDVSALNLAKGTAELTVRDLIKSALLLAPKRIIVGECRGAEVLDLLQTANTGPEGWLATLNAPTPRDALSKLEALTRIADATLPPRAMRTQIASGMDLICHIERMQDNVHRVVQITEVIGMEDDAIRLEDLFTYEASATGPDSRLRGDFASSGVQPVFVSRAERYGLDRTLLELTGLN